MKKSLYYIFLCISLFFSLGPVFAQQNERFDIMFPNGEKKLIGFSKEKTYVRFRTDSGEQEIKMKLGFIHQDSLYDHRPNHPAVALKDIVAIKTAGIAGHIVKDFFSASFIVAGDTSILIGSILYVFKLRDAGTNDLFIGGLTSIGIGIAVEKINIRKWHHFSPGEGIITRPRKTQKILIRAFQAFSIFSYLL